MILVLSFGSIKHYIWWYIN